MEQLLRKPRKARLPEKLIRGRLPDDMRDEIAIARMRVDDIATALVVWSRAEGVYLSESDTPESIAQFLRRNPDPCLVARVDGRIVGAVLCGHDGRRGHIYHLGVDRSVRRRGVGSALLSGCMARLADAGIPVCRASVLTGSAGAQEFWTRAGWIERDHLKLYTGLTEQRQGEQPPPAYL